MWTSSELCCTPGAGFPDGCSVRPKECWVVESYNVRTCMRDDRKCLQGKDRTLEECGSCTVSIVGSCRRFSGRKCLQGKIRAVHYDTVMTCG